MSETNRRLNVDESFWDKTKYHLANTGKKNVRWYICLQNSGEIHSIDGD